MRIAIVSDTHLPRGERRLPPGCVEHLRAASLIVHAGDFTSRSVLRELELYGETAAVHGNVDEPELRRELPSRRQLDVDGTRIGIVHDAGRAHARLERLRGLFPGASAVVFGHSHIPLLERADDGFQIFNPGSPTDRRRAPHYTMGLAEVSAGGVEFELIVLG